MKEKIKSRRREVLDEGVRDATIVGGGGGRERGESFLQLRGGERRAERRVVAGVAPGLLTEAAVPAAKMTRDRRGEELAVRGAELRRFGGGVIGPLNGRIRRRARGGPRHRPEEGKDPPRVISRRERRGGLLPGFGLGSGDDGSRSRRSALKVGAERRGGGVGHMPLVGLLPGFHRGLNFRGPPGFGRPRKFPERNGLLGSGGDGRVEDLDSRTERGRRG